MFSCGFADSVEGALLFKTDGISMEHDDGAPFLQRVKVFERFELNLMDLLGVLGLKF